MHGHALVESEVGLSVAVGQRWLQLVWVLLPARNAYHIGALRGVVGCLGFEIGTVPYLVGEGRLRWIEQAAQHSCEDPLESWCHWEASLFRSEMAEQLFGGWGAEVPGQLTAGGADPSG